MADYKLFRDVVRAVALGDSETASRLDDDIQDGDRGAYNIYVTAMFCVAVGHRFENDESKEAITRFVDEMRYDYRNIDPPIRPLALEAVVRAVFGEEHLLDEVSGTEQLRHQILSIRKIVLQSDQMKERLEEYLKDAETLALQWTSEAA